MKAFVTLTPNTAWDSACLVPGLTLGRLHTVGALVGQPGGKGINVARALHGLDEPVLALGFAGGTTGGRIHRGLKAEGIPCELVGIAGESRTCIALVDLAAGQVTEVNEAGPTLTAGDVATLTERLEARLGEASHLVLCGSAPPGMPAETYRAWGELARSRGVPFALDAKGPALEHGLEARPDVVKPNQEEAEALLGRRLTDDADVEAAVDALLDRANLVALSLGDRGAVVATAQARVRVRPPAVEAKSPVGCGDAFLAGLLSALSRGRSLEEAARLACACGAANAARLLPGCPRPEVEALVPGVLVEVAPVRA